MSAVPPRLMLHQSFHYRKARRCTRADAYNVACHLRQRAELTTVQQASVEELLFTMCTEARGTVEIDVLCA
ncbi:MAG: hypothetical protein JNK82_25930 [Myxococcaceae bacterium]|nr:hypothetical protein [Myxococcaceae bacterium]